MRTGSNHFVGRYAAKRYFAYENASMRDIDRKIIEGVIKIGPPELKPGERLRLIDNGARYEIIEGGAK